MCIHLSKRFNQSWYNCFFFLHFKMYKIINNDDKQNHMLVEIWSTDYFLSFISYIFYVMHLLKMYVEPVANKAAVSTAVNYLYYKYCNSAATEQPSSVETSWRQKKKPMIWHYQKALILYLVINLHNCILLKILKNAVWRHQQQLFFSILT